jgi:hypothetical protein
MTGLIVNGDIQIGEGHDLYLKPIPVENPYPDVIHTSELGMRAAVRDFIVYSDAIEVGDNVDLKEMAECILKTRQAESDMVYWAKKYLEDIEPVKCGCCENCNVAL